MACCPPLQVALREGVDESAVRRLKAGIEATTLGQVGTTTQPVSCRRLHAVPCKLAARSAAVCACAPQPVCAAAGRRPAGSVHLLPASTSVCFGSWSVSMRGRI
jgi:hypothetical protein